MADIPDKWKPMLRWRSAVRKAQQDCLADTGVWVGQDRIFAHMAIESGWTGDPNLDSKGVNRCCPRPGRECSPDCRAKGFMQVYWPPDCCPDWSRIKEPAYNAYWGARTLAAYFKTCGTWDGASVRYFNGASCRPVGVVDVSTGTGDGLYLARIKENIAELHRLGIGAGAEPGEDDPGDDPPGGSNGDGGTNTGTAGPSLAIPDLLALVGNAPRVGLFVLGGVVLLVGALRLVR